MLQNILQTQDILTMSPCPPSPPDPGMMGRGLGVRFCRGRMPPLGPQAVSPGCAGSFPGPVVLGGWWHLQSYWGT